VRITQLTATTELEQTDYLAVDDETAGTRKILPEDLLGGFLEDNYVSYGIDTVTTEQQANARYNLGIGLATTESEGLVQLYDGVDSTSTTMAATAAAVKLAYENGGGGGGGSAIILVSGTVSSLPKTVSSSRITGNMSLIHADLRNPEAQDGTWTITTSDGSLTITGTINGSTDFYLYLTETA